MRKSKKNYERRLDPYSKKWFTPKYYNQKYEFKVNQIKANNKLVADKKKRKRNPIAPSILFWPNLNYKHSDSLAANSFPPTKFEIYLRKALIAGIITVGLFAFQKYVYANFSK